MHKLSVVALRRLTSHPSMILTGVALVILIVLLGAAFTTSIEGKGRRTVFSTQVTPVYAATPDGQGQAIFEQKCQGCHSIGDGQLVGPDLKGITSRRDRDWLISFITSPDQLIAQGDPIAKQLVEEYDTPMPNLGLSEQEAKEVLTYIETQSDSQTASSEVEEQPTLLAADTTGNAAKGRDIFTGSISLKNGGATCISCHNIDGIAALGGGTIAKDLTESYSNLGETGLTSILETTPFPLMKAIYGPRPLEDEEVANLVAFLGETDDVQQEASQQSLFIFIVIGIAGLLLIIIILQMVWRGRLSGVRQSLVKGGSK